MNKLLRTIAIMTIASLLLFSCGKDDESAKVQEVSQKQLKSVAHLSYIPADTPYVIAALEPLPKDVFSHYMKLSSDMFGVYGDMLNAGYDDYLEKNTGEDSTREQREDSARVKAWVDAIKKEFPDGFNEDALENMGFNRESIGAFYGHGLLPVSRTKLAAPDAFIEFFERLQNNAGEEFEKLSLDGATGWTMTLEEDDNGIKFVVAVVNEDLVITAVPMLASENMVKNLLGLVKPEKSLADVDILLDIINNKKYLRTMIGVIDMQQLSSRMLDEPQGVDKELFELMDVDRSEYEMSDVCRAEVREVMDIMPRMLLGIKKLNVKVMEQEWLLEVRPDLAAKLQKIAEPVPGLGTTTGLLSFGMGYNLGEIRKFTLERLAHIEANPYDCERLQMQADQLADVKAMINNPASMMLQGIHGGLFVVEDVDIDKIMKTIEENKDDALDTDAAMSLYAESFGFKMVVAAQNASGLLGMAAMMAPELMDLGLEDNREPVRLNPASPMPLPFDVFAAMSEKALVLSAGIDAANIPASLFETSEREYPPLLAYSIDGNRYTEILDAILSHPMVAQSIEDEGDVTPEQMRKLMGAVYGVLGQVSVEFILREDGLAITQSSQSR